MDQRRQHPSPVIPGDAAGQEREGRRARGMTHAFCAWEASMAEPSNRNTTPERYEETHDPKNPPNSVLHPEVRRTARWSFLLPVIVLAIVAALLWVYWSGQP